MKLRPRDVISYEGRDYVVEGVLTYKLAGQAKVQPLARAVDDGTVLWIEPLLDDADDRILVLKEIRDLTVGTPPPATIVYKGQSYLSRLAGSATVSVDGMVPDRPAGAVEVWRHRAAGDTFLQIEKWPHKTVTLAGDSVHANMVSVLPAP
jgi:hypothetical protein